MRLLRAKQVVSPPRRARHSRHERWRAAIRDLDVRLGGLEQRLAVFDRRIARLAYQTRLQGALVVSVLMHAFIIFGIGFVLPDRSPVKNTAPPLEVVLVNAKSQVKPLKADALAQHNLDGGGNVDTPRRAKSPAPVIPEDKPTRELAAAQKQVAVLEEQARKLLVQQKAAAQVTPPAAEPRQEAQPVENRRPLPTATELMQRSLEIARLEAQIARDWDSYQERPRRRFIGARTQEFRFARYIEDWRQKVERVGELNYPQAARTQRVYGSLVVTVSIKADGSLEKVDINRSSGQQILDDAAVRIVRLAAPFAPFSSDIAKDTDILSITRTWTFTRADQLLTD